MTLDIILLLLLVGSMVWGFRKGFIYTFSHTLGWLGAIVAAFFLAHYVRNFLSNQMGTRDSVYESLHDKFDLSGTAVMDSVDSLPHLVSGGMHSAAEGATDVLASNLTDLIMILLGFIVALILVKALLFFLTRFLSKKQTHGLVGFVDGLLGLIAGAVKGILLVFILLALLLPVINLVSPQHTEALLNALETSRYARVLYDSNFIVLILHTFFS